MTITSLAVLPGAGTCLNQLNFSQKGWLYWKNWREQCQAPGGIRTRKLVDALLLEFRPLPLNLMPVKELVSKLIVHVAGRRPLEFPVSWRSRPETWNTRSPCSEKPPGTRKSPATRFPSIRPLPSGPSYSFEQQLTVSNRVRLMGQYYEHINKISRRMPTV